MRHLLAEEQKNDRKMELLKKKLCVFAAGGGNPFRDRALTAALLRSGALQTLCSVLPGPLRFT